MSDNCYCNEGGICHPCYDAKCEEVKTLKSELEALRACTSQEIEIKALKGFKASWIELKTQLIFSVENYEEHDTSVVVQVLEEMNKQENLNNIPDTNKKVTANKGRL